MSMQIATTILAQLGGNRFLVMTGAKDLIGSADTLRMKLPARMTKNGVTHLTVKLDPSDTYTVTAHKWNARALEMRDLASVRDVYAEDLQRIFTDLTGLHTRL